MVITYKEGIWCIVIFTKFKLVLSFDKKKKKIVSSIDVLTNFKVTSFGSMVRN